MRRNADGSRDLGQLLGRNSLVLMDRHGDDAARKAGEIAQETFASPWSTACRRPAPAAATRVPRDRRARRDGAAAVGIVAAVEPQLALGRKQRRQPAVRQPLHARRPFDVASCRPRTPPPVASNRRRARPRSPHRRSRTDGGRKASAPADRAAVVILIDQAPAFLGRGPALAGDAQWRLHAAGLPLDHGERLARLARDHRRHARA